MVKLTKELYLNRRLNLGKESSENKKKITIDQCPHCGQKLSPWQQILLEVDRALVCKNCWYRIILDDVIKNQTKSKSQEEKNKDI